MSLTPQQVKTAISIGKYGGCLPACSGGLIIGRYNLAGCRVVVEIVRGQEGGSYPLLPGQIQHLYQPVVNKNGWWTRIDDPRATPRQLVKVVVKFKGEEHERYFFLKEKTKNAVVRVSNFINTTEKYINVVINNIKHLATKGTVRIKNLMLKYWKR